MEELGSVDSYKIDYIDVVGKSRWVAKMVNIACNINKLRWSGRRDSNPRPSAPKADALPGCATPRRALSIVSRIRFGVVPADPNIATIEELRPSKLNQQVEPVSSAGCRQWLQPAGPRKCLDANLLISRPWLVQFGQEF